MNLLMKIDRWLGAILVIVAILGYLFHWFTSQLLLSALAAGILLVIISFTSDKGRSRGTRNKKD
ncbi:hypothetical protein [Companilactobacillus baiquanensis]|uniref:DUF1056 family protein n=1 Tax=Companilactobacillus baiquanensis TaxID=2486005 RepID=A0ABW1UUJ3_9LACO|nr:hypothetical protein [Companilactobacillus baiquanensis]